MSPPSCFFFPANESISSWSSSSVACSCSLFNQIFLVSVFGSCHRSERRRKTRIVKEQIYLAIHLWLFLALKNLCIVPANAPDPRKYRINQNKRTTGVRQQLPFVIRLSYLFFCLDFDWFLFILSPKLVLFFLPANFAPVCVVSPLMSSNEKIQEASERDIFFVYLKEENSC